MHVSDLDGDRRLVIDGEPVTPDGLQVREVSGADGETVYFIGIQEPTEEHLWRYDPEQGLHRISDSPGVHGGTAAGGTVVRSSWTEAGATMTVTSADAETPNTADRLPGGGTRAQAENHLAHRRRPGAAGGPAAALLVRAAERACRC